MDTWRASMLIVDDDPANRLLLARFMERDNYLTTTAAGGAEALELLQDQSFDLVLLDLLMPEVDGYMVLEQIKANPHLRAMPVIIISGQDNSESLTRCLEAGAEDYLAKPFSRSLLQARVRAALTRHRLADQVRRSMTLLTSDARARLNIASYVTGDLRYAAIGISTYAEALLSNAPDDTPTECLRAMHSLAIGLRSNLERLALALVQPGQHPAGLDSACTVGTKAESPL